MTRAVKFCNNAVVVCYCALVFFLPISIALVESFAGAVILFYLLKKVFAWDLKPHGSLLAGAMFGNILVVLTTVFFSKFFMVSLFAFFAKFIEGCFLYYSFVECFDRKQYIRWFIRVLAFSAAVIALSGLSQYFFHYEFVRHMPLESGRISSTFRNANDFGAYLIPISSLILAFLLMYVSSAGLRVWHKALLAALMVLPLACLGLTYSRSSWGGFFVAMVLIGVMCRSMMYNVLLITVFLAVFLPLMMIQRNVSFVSDNLTRSAVVTQTFGGMGRMEFWREAEKIIKQFPLFGSGLNTYSRVAPGYKINWGGYPHNCYLQMAAETGIVGLVSFLVLMGVLFFRGWRSIARMKDLFLKSAALGAYAGLAGFLLQSGLDTTLYSVQLANLMWILMGLIVAAIHVDGLTKEGKGL